MDILRQGQTGSSVKQWQLFLLGQGYEISTDGDFGPKTKAATQDFQKKYGLVPNDGVVGRDTYAKAVALGFGEIQDSDTNEEGPGWPPRPALGPLDSQERAALFGTFKYEPAPTQGNPEGILIRDNWAVTNIVKVTIPQLIGKIGAPGSGTIFFHRKAADQLKALWAAWEAAGLLPLVLSFAGSYVPRFIRGSRTNLSNHAWGTAFDINAPQNPLGAEPALVGKLGSVRKLVPLAREHGFFWGGHFPGRQDGMHFEVQKIV